MAPPSPRRGTSRLSRLACSRRAASLRLGLWSAVHGVPDVLAPVHPRCSRRLSVSRLSRLAPSATGHKPSDCGQAHPGPCPSLGVAHSLPSYDPAPGRSDASHRRPAEKCSPAGRLYQAAAFPPPCRLRAGGDRKPAGRRKAVPRTVSYERPSTAVRDSGAVLPL